MNTKNDIKILMEKYLNHQATATETQEILDWMQKNPRLCLWLRNHLEATRPDILQEIQHRVFERIVGESEVEKPKHHAFLGIRNYWKVACVILLVLMAGMTATYFAVEQNKTLYDFPLMVKTNAGERSIVVLPDGTEVTINAKSKIYYDCNYVDGNRMVSLDGEAYFDVHPDKQHPFKVQTNGLEIECLGTEFNVKSYHEDDQVAVVLTEGKVSVSSDETSVVMEPNMRLIYDKQTAGMSQAKVNSDDYTLWMKGEIRYNDQTLEDISKDIARMFHVNMVIVSDRLKQERFTGYLGNCSLRNVLDLLTVASDLEYSIDNDTVVYVYEKGATYIKRN